MNTEPNPWYWLEQRAEQLKNLTPLQPLFDSSTVSLRDQMAMAALQGLLAHKPFNKADIARSAYEYADMMLEVRVK